MSAHLGMPKANGFYGCLHMHYVDRRGSVYVTCNKFSQYLGAQIQYIKGDIFKFEHELCLFGYIASISQKLFRDNHGVIIDQHWHL